MRFFATLLVEGILQQSFFDYSENYSTSHPQCLKNDFQAQTNPIDRDSCIFTPDPNIQITPESDDTMSLKEIENSQMVHKSCSSNQYCYSCCEEMSCKTVSECNYMFEIRRSEANIYVILYLLSFLVIALLLIINHFLLHNNYKQSLKEMLFSEYDYYNEIASNITLDRFVDHDFDERPSRTHTLD